MYVLPFLSIFVGSKTTQKTIVEEIKIKFSREKIKTILRLSFVILLTPFFINVSQKMSFFKYFLIWVLNVKIKCAKIKQKAREK